MFWPASQTVDLCQANIFYIFLFDGLFLYSLSALFSTLQKKIFQNSIQPICVRHEDLKKYKIIIIIQLLL